MYSFHYLDREGVISEQTYDVIGVINKDGHYFVRTSEIGRFVAVDGSNKSIKIEDVKGFKNKKKESE